MLLLILAGFVSLALGYLLTSYIHGRLQGSSSTAGSSRRKTRSAPLIQAPARPSPTTRTDEMGDDDVKPRTLLIKRGKTKDHVKNLQHLMLQRKAAGQQMQRTHSLVGEMQSRPRDQDDVKPLAPVSEELLSHPVFCPPVEPMTDEQGEKIAQLREAVKDVMIPYFSDERTYFRFLTARNWELDRAETMLRDAIEWRHSLTPLDDELCNQISLAMATKLSIVMDDKDKFGRTILYFCPRRHNSKQREVETALRAMVWFMDYVWLRTRDTHYRKFVVLFNMRGFSMRNNDLQMLRGFLPILQNCYPEMVGRIILVEYPFIIWGLWKIVKSLLDVRTQNKVQFIGPAELADHFTPETIPTEIGGLWEMPDAEVDLWEDGFDFTAWKQRPEEVIEEYGVYRIKN